LFGIDRVDLTAHVDGSIGQDHLLRARFQFDAPGLLPVAEVGFGAVGRSFGFPEADAAASLWTLDSPAHTWAGLSSTVRLNLRREDRDADDVHAIGVAEVVDDTSADRAEHVRALIAALAAKGVTSTLTKPDGERYGALDADSNLPDVRIVLGRHNAFAAAVLDEAGPQYREALDLNGRVFVPALRTRREQWVPDADLRLVPGRHRRTHRRSVRRRDRGPGAGRPSLDHRACRGLLDRRPQSGDVGLRGELRKRSQREPDACVQRVPVAVLDRGRATYGAGRVELRVAALVTHLRAEHRRGAGRLARERFLARGPRREPPRTRQTR
jgi:hypothetical protein